MFSDMSMLANETLVKHVNKDPEGYGENFWKQIHDLISVLGMCCIHSVFGLLTVPINFVSTLKKLKSLNVNNQMVAQALRSSSKLVSLR